MAGKHHKPEEISTPPVKAVYLCAADPVLCSYGRSC
ncbi:MAG: hypothetical protein JWO24_1097, partial [Rhodospirillales bacterium]|nr:hypothetical protein [Rhodospirillales bacterium]